MADAQGGSVSIRPLDEAAFARFFAYLDKQLAENGKHGSPLFQPVSRDLHRFPPEKQRSFTAGLERDIGSPGWRRAWILHDDSGGILGHVDLRAHHESNTPHRALLGMGVAGGSRRRGHGRRLVHYACEWARRETSLAWIDIEVLSGNRPAIALYAATGFTTQCTIEDMFRIDGNPESLLRMTLALRHGT